MFWIFYQAGGDDFRTRRGPRVALARQEEGGAIRARSGPLAISKPGILLLLLALALTACGNGGGGARSAGSSAERPPPEADRPVPPGEGASSADASAVPATSSAAQVEGDEGGVGAALPDFDGEKIIKTAKLGIRAENVREGASRAQGVASRFGGEVSSSRINGGGEPSSAELVLSIPSPEFEAALDELRSLGDVTTDTVGGEDATEEYVDLKSRERNLLAAEQSLLRLYDQAKSVDDALYVGRELTDVRGQIETVQGRIRFLDDRATASRIVLEIEPVAKPAPSSPAWEPARAVSRAWNASLAFLGTVGSAVISALVFGWWLAPAVVAAAVWWRRRTRHASPAEGP